MTRSIGRSSLPTTRSNILANISNMLQHTCKNRRFHTRKEGPPSLCARRKNGPRRACAPRPIISGCTPGCCTIVACVGPSNFASVCNVLCVCCKRLYSKCQTPPAMPIAEHVACWGNRSEPNIDLLLYCYSARLVARHATQVNWRDMVTQPVFLHHDKLLQLL
jgi:hypothetical protein